MIGRFLTSRDDRIDRRSSTGSSGTGRYRHLVRIIVVLELVSNRDGFSGSARTTRPTCDIITLLHVIKSMISPLVRALVIFITVIDIIVITKTIPMTLWPLLMFIRFVSFSRCFLNSFSGRVYNVPQSIREIITFCIIYFLLFFFFRQAAVLLRTIVYEYLRECIYVTCPIKTEY